MIRQSFVMTGQRPYDEIVSTLWANYVKNINGYEAVGRAISQATVREAVFNHNRLLLGLPCRVSQEPV